MLVKTTIPNLPVSDSTLEFLFKLKYEPEQVMEHGDYFYVDGEYDDGYADGFGCGYNRALSDLADHLLSQIDGDVIDEYKKHKQSKG